MAGMRWSQTANYGYWNNPAMPNTFGAQVYDLGDPWAKLGDGNTRAVNKTTGLPLVPPQTKCCIAPNAKFNITGDPGCPDKNATDPAMQKACADSFECALPDPKTGKYGKACLPFNGGDWSPAMQSVAALVRLNAPSGLPGVNFMGGIHPRLKRPVGRRLAYAAARLIKEQQQQQQQQQQPTSDDNWTGGGGVGSGAFTGPTISGCRYTPSSSTLEIKFNQTLLGGEGLMLRPYDVRISSYTIEIRRLLIWSALHTIVFIALSPRVLLLLLLQSAASAAATWGYSLLSSNVFF